MTSRNEAVQAVFDLLTTKITFASKGRRLRDPKAIAPEQTPALMLVDHSEHFHRKSPSMPAMRELDLRAIVYTDVGDDENAIPGATINDLLDRIEDALAPDDVSTNCCTLSRRVASVMIDGEVIKAPGDITGKSLAIVPIRIVLP
jgi:hypothetical protein